MLKEAALGGISAKESGSGGGRYTRCEELSAFVVYAQVALFCVHAAGGSSCGVWAPYGSSGGFTGPLPDPDLGHSSSCVASKPCSSGGLFNIL